MAKIKHRKFYYFYDRYMLREGIVNRSLLESDIQRGVKHLNEEAYCKLWGSTDGSLYFLGALINYFGQEGIKASRADLTINKDGSPVLHVYTKSGYCFVFRGVSGGFYGNGPRGCHDILNLCGFSEKQCNRPFEKETFVVYKRK